MLVTLSLPAGYAYVLDPVAGGVLGALAHDRINRSSSTLDASAVSRAAD